MGILLDKLKQIELGTSTTSGSNNNLNNNGRKRKSGGNGSGSGGGGGREMNYKTGEQFPDLEAIPPELSLQILKYLNATDLCLASCVWSSLANDDILWQSLCKSTWAYASVYNRKMRVIDYSNDKDQIDVDKSFRSIFMHLDEATLTFNADWKKVFYSLYSSL